VIDPTRLDATQLEAATVLLRETPRPTVIHPPLTPEGVHVGLALARDAGGVLVYQSPEQDFEFLVNTILAAAHPADTGVVLGALMPRLALLPSGLRDAVVAMFTSEPGLESPDALARRAAMSRRSLDRWLERAGITSARLLVGAPKLLRALRLLRETTLSLRRIARICGYTSARRFKDQAVALTQLAPAELRQRTVPVADVLERIASAIQEPPMQGTLAAGGHNGAVRGRPPHTDASN
jgi:AraC-like DNA-binding protein